ncbi:MAG: o-succinylbenzoate synthase [Gemmatimonadales bacterium]
MTVVAVKRAGLYEVSLPLVQPFRLSGGELAVRRSLIVELEDAYGLTGYGESAPFEAPFYSAETVESARSCLCALLLPRVLERPVSAPRELSQLLHDGFRGNEMARAGVETAWWDLVAARRGVSLAQLVTERLRELGVADRWHRRRRRLECGIAIGIPEPADASIVERDVERAIRAGYRRIKLKIKPGWDEEPVRAARDALRSTGSELPLTADANGAYDPERDRALLRALDRFGLLYLEQPFSAESLWDSCELARELATPLCLDETLTSEAVARQVVAMSGPVVWNIKIQRVGGLEEACRIYARGVREGMKLWAGTMPETGVGAQAILALGAHAGFVYPSDVEPSNRWYRAGTDLIELRMHSDGTMDVPEERITPSMEGRARLLWERHAGG